MEIEQEKLVFVEKGIAEIEDSLVSVDTHDLRYSDNGETVIIRFVPSGYRESGRRGNTSDKPILELVFNKNTGELLDRHYAR